MYVIRGGYCNAEMWDAHIYEFQYNKIELRKLCKNMDECFV